MRSIVIGNKGQIGSAIQTILDCDGEDSDFAYEGTYDVLHVCFPWSDSFVEKVVEYQQMHLPQLTIIHSTVPVGTTKQIPNAVHSPCRGKHPDLEGGIRTFVKFFGGEKAAEAAAIFTEAGITCRMTPNSDTTEYMKLMDTEQYRDAIIREKQIHEYCTEHGLDFDVVYTEANQTYNEGYEQLGMPQYKKYVLTHMEGPIGGHCVEPNHGILQDT